MRSIVTLILIISLFGCKKQNVQQEPLTFDSIDYSFFLGYLASIKILSTGEMFIYENSDYPDVNKYYSLKLDKTDLDSLSKMTSALFNTKIDSVYQAPVCDHPVSFCLIIKSKQNNLMTSYYGDLDETEWIPLFRLTSFLDFLGKKTMQHSDSTAEFKSRARLILPPDPPKLVL